jgi:hypothetical protein
MIDRFSAYLLIRRFLKRPDSRNQALAVEAIMEELAGRRGQSRSDWGIVGMLSQLDLEYTEQNPHARGRTARQQAETEGLTPEEAAPLERWCASWINPQEEGLLSRDEEPAPLEDALVLATMAAEGALGRDDYRAVDESTAAALSHDLQLRSQQGDRLGDRIDEALQRMSIDAAEIGELTVVALQRVAEDIR